MQINQSFLIRFFLCSSVALFFLYQSFRNYQEVEHKMACWDTTNATIVGFSLGDFGEEDYFRPEVAFTSKDGQKVTAVSPIGRKSNPLTEGDTLRIFYNPDQPTEIMEDSLSGLYLVSAAWLAFSMIPIYCAYRTCRKYGITLDSFAGRP